LLRTLVVARDQTTADNRSRYRLRARSQLHARSLELIENRAQRLLRAELEWKFGKPYRQRLARVVSKTRDFPSIFLLDRERLEHIVHLRRFEIEPSRFPRRELSRPLEIADSMLVKRALPHRQIRRDRCRYGKWPG